MDNRRQFEAFFATADGLAKLVDSLFSVSWVDAVKGEEFIRMLFHQFIHNVVRYRVTLRLIPLQEIARHFPHVDHSSRNENRLVDPCLPHLRQEKIFVTIILARNVGMSVDDHLFPLQEASTRFQSSPLYVRECSSISTRRGNSSRSRSLFSAFLLNSSLFCGLIPWGIRTLRTSP